MSKCYDVSIGFVSDMDAVFRVADDEAQAFDDEA
jgi:hypothetical protein